MDEKKFCPRCGNGQVKRNGLYGNGKQRWWCHACRRSFSIRNIYCKHLKEQVWFKRWISEGFSVRQLVLQSGHGRDKLYRIINYWLKEEVHYNLKNLTSQRYLIFDGTYLHRPVSLAALMEAASHQIISGKYAVSENSTSELISFFRPLKTQGLNPRSCTVDGNPQVIQVITSLWPEIIIQRCLVHIQRQGLSWCRHYPKTVSARKLRELFLLVTNIHTKPERDLFINRLIDWEQKYGGKIGKQPETGRVFSDLKRARSMLMKALPDMFHYLDEPAIASTTNSLEGYFSRLKGHYRQHRGLSPNKLNHYFSWYFFFKPK